MFPERRTAKLLSSGAAKLRYSCNDGLAPYFRQILTEKNPGIRNLRCFI